MLVFMKPLLLMPLLMSSLFSMSTHSQPVNETLLRVTIAVDGMMKSKGGVT